jgi:hypothetical protein
MQTKNYDARGDVNVRKVTNICSSLNFRFVHLSIGLDVAWAVDSDGKMWMRIGDVNHPKDKESGAVPVWIPVESASSAETKFSRVSASSSSSSSLNIVWAVGDGDGRVYARLGIYGNFRLGLDWTAVPGVTNAVDVKASDSAVYVLTGNGRVLRRYGISADDHVGTVWKEVPTDGAVTSLSVTVCDAVYGVDRSGYVCEEVREEVGLTRSAVTSVSTAGDRGRLRGPRVASECEDEEGWAIVE